MVSDSDLLVLRAAPMRVFGKPSRMGFVVIAFIAATFLFRIFTADTAEIIAIAGSFVAMAGVAFLIAVLMRGARIELDASTLKYRRAIRWHRARTSDIAEVVRYTMHYPDTHQTAIMPVSILIDHRRQAIMSISEEQFSPDGIQALLRRLSVPVEVIGGMYLPQAVHRLHPGSIPFPTRSPELFGLAIVVMPLTLLFVGWAAHTAWGHG